MYHEVFRHFQQFPHLRVLVIEAVTSRGSPVFPWNTNSEEDFFERAASMSRARAVRLTVRRSEQKWKCDVKTTSLHFGIL